MKTEQAEAMAQVCLDMHAALGIKWGDDPYARIKALTEFASGEAVAHDHSLPAKVIQMCQKRGWSMHWTHRGAYLHLESSELIEAIRGKHGDPMQEAGDVLLVLMSITEYAGIPWHNVIQAAETKCAELMVKPHYAGEEYAAPRAEPDYEALEREHFGDSEKKTGIYAKEATTNAAEQATYLGETKDEFIASLGEQVLAYNCSRELNGVSRCPYYCGARVCQPFAATQRGSHVETSGAVSAAPHDAQDAELIARELYALFYPPDADDHIYEMPPFDEAKVERLGAYATVMKAAAPIADRLTALAAQRDKFKWIVEEVERLIDHKGIYSWPQTTTLSRLIEDKQQAERRAADLEAALSEARKKFDALVENAPLDFVGTGTIASGQAEEKDWNAAVDAIRLLLTAVKP